MVTLSDICNKEIKRTDNIAEIIWDYIPEGAVRLIGFNADASLSDFEIYELGFDYYKRLMEEVDNLR